MVNQNIDRKQKEMRASYKRKTRCLTIGCSKARGGALDHDLAVQPPLVYKEPCALPCGNHNTWPVRLIFELKRTRKRFNWIGRRVFWILFVILDAFWDKYRSSNIQKLQTSQHAHLKLVWGVDHIGGCKSLSCSLLCGVDPRVGKFTICTSGCRRVGGLGEDL